VVRTLHVGIAVPVALDHYTRIAGTAALNSQHDRAPDTERRAELHALLDSDRGKALDMERRSEPGAEVRQGLHAFLDT
jgi:hypothetical protein